MSWAVRLVRRRFAPGFGAAAALLVLGTLVLGTLVLAPGTVQGQVPASGPEAAPPQAASVARADSSLGPSPRGALLRSTLVPGWGQLATGHPVKAGVIAAGVLGLSVRIGMTTREANDATQRANEAETAEEYDRLAAERDGRLAARDNAVTWLLLLWSYNMIDAYVEGHFVGFDGLQWRLLESRRASPADFPIASITFRW